jgi:hypothetical protein
MDYADARRLTIFEHDDIPSEDSLLSVISIWFSTTEVTTSDAIPDRVWSEISAINQRAYDSNDYDRAIQWYTLEDRRQYNNVGASSAFQDIIVTIASEATAMAVTTAGAYLVARLAKWGASKFSKRSAGYRQHDPDSKAEELSSAISLAKDVITTHYKPSGEISVESSSISDATTRVVLVDQQGTKYEARTQLEPPYATQVRRMKLRKKDV